MCKDVALAGKIDAEHRSRQNLRHSAFGDDLFFLRHQATNIRANATAFKERRSLVGRAPAARHCRSCEKRLSAPRLTELFQRKCWQVFAQLLTFPPRARSAKLIHCCKSIPIKHRAKVPRRFVREWVVCEQTIH